jgi:hypothetical protein
MDLVESLINIKLYKDFGFTNSSQDLINKGERVMVFISNLVKLPVINIEL